MPGHGAPTEWVQGDDVYFHSFKRTTAHEAWMIMKIKAQTKHAHGNEPLASKQLTLICGPTVDDVFLSFSRLSICPFQLINVVFLTLSLPLHHSLVCSNLFKRSSASIYLFIYLCWWEWCQWNLIWQGKQTPKLELWTQNVKTQTHGCRYDHPWGGGGTLTASELSQCIKQIPFSHRSSEVNVQTNECQCLWSAYA